MPRSADDHGREGADRVRSGAKLGERGALAPAASLADFASAPLGRFFGGEHFVYAWPRPDLCVTVVWGEPGLEDFERLASLYALELHAPAEPHASVIDAHKVERMGQRGFEKLAAYVEAHREVMRKWVTRLAIVRPSGFAGAIAAGFYETTEAPYPVEVFAEPADAYAWVGAAPSTAATLAALVEGSSDAPAMLRELRRALEARLPDATLEGLAKDLGLAVRTLQRRLKEHGTTFRRELSGAQVRAAERWLSGTDAPISRIAFEVGCGTPQHLSALFKQTTGQSPTEWRAARRG
jgi:AraC-like DNA-binding protein